VKLGPVTEHRNCARDIDTGYWILDTGYWILDTGYSILGPTSDENPKSRIENVVRLG